MPQISRDMITIIQGLVILFLPVRLENMFRPALTTFFCNQWERPAPGGQDPAGRGNRIMEYFGHADS